MTFLEFSFSGRTSNLVYSTPCDMRSRFFFRTLERLLFCTDDIPLFLSSVFDSSGSLETAPTRTQALRERPYDSI